MARRLNVQMPLRLPIDAACPRRRPRFYRRGLAFLLAASLPLRTGCRTAWVEDDRPAQTRFPAGDYVLPTRTARGLFLADARLDGTGPYPVILDMRISGLLLDDHVAEALRIRHFTGNRIQRLEIGRWQAAGPVYQSRDLSGIATALGEPIAGIVGSALFHDATVTFDYPRRQVRLSRSGLDRKDPSTVRLDFDIQHRPRLYYRVGGQMGWALIATGTDAGVMLPAPGGISWQSKPVPVGRVPAPSGTPILRIGRAASTGRFGPIKIEHPIIGYRRGPALIGVHVLKHYAVSLDQPHRLARFEPQESTPVNRESFRILAGGFSIGPEAVEVTELYMGTPAAAAGLAIGDRIVAINGHSIVDLAPEGIRLLSPDTDIARLEVERDGQHILYRVPVTVIP